MDNRKQEIINNCNDYFESFFERKNINLDEQKVSTNCFNACMIYIYDIYVSTLENVNNRGIKQYKPYDYIYLCQWYIAKSLEYNYISLYGFCLLINRTKQWLYLLKNSDIETIGNSFYIECNIDNNISVVLDDNIYSNKEGVKGGENVSALLQDITQKLFANYQESAVSKLNDSTIGLIANANNNKDLGLEYAKERIELQAKTRIKVSLNDLPLIE